MQFVFIFAKPCLFLSRFDCYSAGWDGAFSQSACFQGANNERLSIWRHGGKNRSPSSGRKQSAAARPHASAASLVRGWRILSPSRQGCLPQCSAEALSRMVLQGTVPRDTGLGQPRGWPGGAQQSSSEQPAHPEVQLQTGLCNVLPSPTGSDAHSKSSTQPRLPQVKQSPG